MIQIILIYAKAVMYNAPTSKLKKNRSRRDQVRKIHTRRNNNFNTGFLKEVCFLEKQTYTSEETAIVISKLQSL